MYLFFSLASNIPSLQKTNFHYYNHKRSMWKICVGSTPITSLCCSTTISWLHALKQLNFALLTTIIILRMCWVKFSKKLSFSESLHSACSVFVSFFLFLCAVFELFKRLGAPCMFFSLLLFSVLFSSLSNSTFLCVQMLSEQHPFFPFRLDVIVAACGLGVFI